jgi:hypothetical protein
MLSDLNKALAKEIKRLPLWRFPRDRVATWALSTPATASVIRDGVVIAKVTPIMQSGWDGCGSWLHGRLTSDLAPEALARAMVDDLLADPRFETSTGTPC